MTPRRITVGDRTYELSSWAVADGDLWAFRLLQLLTSGASAGSASESDALALGTLLERVTPETFLAFRDACFKHTSLVELDASGEELVRELPRAREAMRGRYSDVLAIVAAHIEHEFLPFLLSAGDILGGGKGTKKKAAAPASSSPAGSTG